MKKRFILILFILLVQCSDEDTKEQGPSPEELTQPSSCYEPVKKAVLKKTKELKIYNEQFFDGGFGELKTNSYDVRLSGDVILGTFYFTFNVDVSVNKDTCTVNSVTEVSREREEFPF